MRIAQQGYNAAAIKSQQLQAIVPLSGASIILDRTFDLDPQCPFFYCFSAGGTGDDNAFESIFSFTNGGMIVSEFSICWGTPAKLEASGLPSTVSIQTGNNDGFLYFHDTVANICANVLPGTDDVGFVHRWTSLADKVRCQVKPFGTLGVTSGYQIVSGILQQAW